MGTDLGSLEIPRHVHRRDGTSLIVQTLGELEDAVAAGWIVDLNAPVDQQPAEMPETEAEPETDSEAPAEAPADELVDAAGVESEAEAPSDEIAEPAKRKPGRPRGSTKTK